MAVAGLISARAFAQDGTTPAQAPAGAPAAPEASAPKKVTVTTGVDFASAYFFRGIAQQSGGTIAQPYFDVGIAVAKNVTVNVGNWDSVHSATLASNGGHWYESDYYGSVTFTAGKVKPGLLYTSYTSPADRFTTVKELAGVLAFDDSASAVPLSPKFVLAFELSDQNDDLASTQADAGTQKGVYFEAGVKPAFKLAPKATLLIPVKLGLSFKDYYEGVGLGGPKTDDKFGYFDTGLQLSVPAISGSGGALELHGGVDFLFLGDNLKAYNGGDGVKPVALIGFTYTY
jgi:hypothetical protein